MIQKKPAKKDRLILKVNKRNRKILLNRKLTILPQQWWLGTSEIILLTFLCFFNFILLLPFFGQEDQYNSFSAPLIPLLARSTFFLSFPQAIRFWLLVFILFLAPALYFLIREIAKRRITAFLAALIVSLPVGIFLPLRIKMALFAEDGSYIASLSLSILACLFILRFLRTGNFKTGIIASLIICLTALTSPLGLFVLGCFALAITASEMLLNQARLKFCRFLIVFILAAGLASFWYNPIFVFLIIGSPQGELVKGTLLSLFPLSFFLVPVLGAFGYLLFENQPKLQPLFMAIFLSLGFILLSLGAGIRLSSPGRFLPSLGISLSFLLGFILTNIFNFWQKKADFKRFIFLSRFRHLITRIAVGLFFILIMVTIIVSKPRMQKIAEDEFLDLNGVKRAGIWEMREGMGFLSNIIGGSISLFTLGLIYLLAKKIKHNGNGSENF